MVSGSQKVKTPTGGMQPKVLGLKQVLLLEAVDQIYIKTPDGWNDAS